jgi:hypothetical protein
MLIAALLVPMLAASAIGAVAFAVRLRGRRTAGRGRTQRPGR